MSSDECIKMQKTGYYDLGNRIVSGLKPNSSEAISHVYAGGLDNDGS